MVNRETYAKAGVDIDKKAKAIEALKKELKIEKSSLLDLGHFTGLISFGKDFLTLCTDGVGTKILVAKALGKYDTIGIDCIAMNVNDTICIGARPLAFVDYLSMAQPDEKIASAIGKGLNKGAFDASVEIVGGEIAIMPELINGIDLAGSCLGYVKKNKVITGEKIEEYDTIIGLKSSGIHSNGLTLARKVFEKNNISYKEKIPGLKGTVGEELLIPTKIYVKPLLELIKKFDIHGIANITGGGLRNIIRLNKNFEFIIDEPFEPQKIFDVIMELGKIEQKEMYQTFNMGMGATLIVSRKHADKVLEFLKNKAEAKVVGYVKKGRGVYLKEHRLRYIGY
ncbi:MAG: phosphoribosylformylglycinamidine cyclo-ligase [Candidatus Thermoplasmatota archaeon]